jgi:hypothetical protein
MDSHCPEVSNQASFKIGASCFGWHATKARQPLAALRIIGLALDGRLVGAMGSRPCMGCESVPERIRSACSLAVPLWSL